jgi:hypothetical protein
MTRFSDMTGGAIYAPDPSDKRGTRVYFDVDDMNAGNGRVKELGGEAGEAMPVPSMGWFSMCKDTEGNDFGLWQSRRGTYGMRVATASNAGGSSSARLLDPFEDESGSDHGVHEFREGHMAHANALSYALAYARATSVPASPPVSRVDYSTIPDALHERADEARVCPDVHEATARAENTRTFHEHCGSKGRV